MHLPAPTTACFFHMYAIRSWFFVRFVTTHTVHTSQSTLHTSHCFLHTPNLTLHTSHFTLRSSHSKLKLHTPHFTLLTSHCFLHTAHFTLHSSRPTLHTALNLRATKKHERQNGENLLTNPCRSLHAATPIRFTRSSCKRQ